MPAAEDQPSGEILTELKNITTKLNTMDAKLTELVDDIAVVKKLAEYSSKTAEDALKKATELEKKVTEIHKQNTELKKSNTEMKERIIQIEGQSRRNNLLFDGIAEKRDETWEDTEYELVKFMQRQLNIDDAEYISFERVHRLGIKNNKPRTIVAKFSFYKEREIVWNSRSKLSRTNFWVSEDYPPEVKRDRQILYPIYRCAKDQPGVTSCDLKVNKLYINKKQYTVSTLNELPDHLTPEKLCNRSDNVKKTTVFFRKDSLLSNFNTNCPISVSGMDFNCVEQFYQYRKATFFKKEDKAAQIMNQLEPRIQKSIGDQVHGGRAETNAWQRESLEVMKLAITAKMEQNPLAKAALLRTADYVLGEASRDSFWGTGLPLHHKKANDPNFWTGENHLGKIMTDVRNTLNEN